MPRYLYSVWFRDAAAEPDDQDREWVACIEIEGETSEAARDWGDTLARRRSHGTTDTFLNSKAEPYGGADQLPFVRVGEDAEDGHIGW
jgi:hypothetical protein